MTDPILELFNKFKTILCMCPHCNSLMRINDLHLRSDSKAPLTWLDRYEKSISKIEKQEDVFSKQEKMIRDKANAKGRAQVPKLVKKSMDEKFSKLNFDPYDIKAILHPIDFVVFNGMNNGSVNDVILLSRKTVNPLLQSFQGSIESAINSKNYDWAVVRVTDDGEVKYE